MDFSDAGVTLAFLARIFAGESLVVPSQAMQRVEGTVLAGKYALVSKLGQGGMGSVWRAEHVQLRSPVAIKLIDQQIAQNPEALSRFMREAQSAAALRSPHVVQILDFGADQGVPYIAMELLEGESLAARLDRVGRLTPTEAAHFLTHVARAVSKAHEGGIVHRDLKPDNIFIVRNDEEEVAKVLDFGIAKAGVGFGATTGSATRTGAVMGTPYYMSPEQAEGTKLVDHRTDLWALGVIGFECLIGRRPFESDALGSLLLAICTRPIPVPSSLGPVPMGFDAWFARACARELHERFQTARELAGELRRVCTGQQAAYGGARASDPAYAGAPAATPYGSHPGMGSGAMPHAPAPTANTYSTSVGLEHKRTPWLALGIVTLFVAAAAAAGIVVVARSRAAPEVSSASAPLEASVPAAPAAAPPPPLVEPHVEPVPVASNVPSTASAAPSAAPIATAGKPARALASKPKAGKPAASTAPATLAPKTTSEPKPTTKPTSEPKPAPSRVNLGI
jgi:serine/threonine-protein kinase